MDNQNQTKLQTNQDESRSPDFRLSLVTSKDDGDHWASIGVGWLHKDGEGITFSGHLLKIFGIKLIALKAQPKD